jgi:hypothetical protein
MQSKNNIACITGSNQSTVNRLDNYKDYQDNPTMDSLLRVEEPL